MKYYAPENATFQLPFQFDIKALQQDLETCRKYNFLQNYVPENYHGKDYILPLRSIEGNMNFPAAAPGNPELFKDTAALKECPYFKKVLEAFLCEKEAVRLMSLPPGAVMNTHTDHECGYEDGIFRVHVPIITNDEVYFILNDERVVMQAGEAWYTNVNLPHSVANKGETHRVHLVIDGIRNDWSDELFGKMGFKFELEREIVPEYDQPTLRRMIEELERKADDGAKVLVEQLKQQLGTS